MITTQEIIVAANLAGIPVKEQSSFHKVHADGKAVYLSKTKKVCTRCDISGFTVDHPAVVPLDKKNGKVTGTVDMTHPEARAAIELALEGIRDGIRGLKEDTDSVWTEPVEEVEEAPEVVVHIELAEAADEVEVPAPAMAGRLDRIRERAGV